jgi:hypothetical protein
LYIGFDGPAEEGQKLIAVHRPHAKVWVIEREHAPDYKYGHYVLSLCLLLSSISFDRFRLNGSHFVIELPEHNLKPGAHAQLGVPFFAAPNQIWVVTLGESYSQELSCFYTHFLE